MSAFETINADSFIDGLINELWYADKDYHDLYLSEIVEISQK